MKAIITSCNRLELLIETLESLWGFDEYIIYEDSDMTIPKVKDNQRVVRSYENQGQNECINQLYQLVKDENFVFHCEDDWKFSYNNTGWIANSVNMIKEYNLIKVSARDLDDNPHKNVSKNGIILPWKDGNGNVWNGFTWNPGVTHVPKLLEYLPNYKSEADLDKIVKYKTGQLMPGVCHHIGYEMSTRT